MPPLSPALIGAPSPVGRGAVAPGVDIGSVIFAVTNPDPKKYLPCDGSLADLNLSTWPFAPVGAPPIGFSDTRNMGSVNDGNAQAPVYLSKAGVFVWATFNTGPLWTSPDGKVWTSITNPAGSSIRAMDVFAGRLFVVADGGAWVSDDAATFTKIPGYAGGYNMAASPGLIYLSGPTADLDYYSFDGVTFSKATGQFNGSGFQTSWIFPAPQQGLGRYIINVYSYSANAYQAYIINSLTSSAGTGIFAGSFSVVYRRQFYFNGLFLLWGQGADYRWTKDFATYNTPVFDTGQARTGPLILAGGQVLAVGGDGSIHQSYDGMNFKYLGGAGNVATDVATLGTAYGNNRLVSIKTNGRSYSVDYLLNKARIPLLSGFNAKDNTPLQAFVRVA